MFCTSGKSLRCRATDLYMIRANTEHIYRINSAMHLCKVLTLRTYCHNIPAARVPIPVVRVSNRPIEQHQASERLPHIQRALGVDYGRRHIGLAVSTLGLAPRALSPMPGGRASDVPRLAAEVIERAKTEGCQGIVVGLPVTKKGALWRPWTDSQQGRRCRNFALNVAALAESLGLSVFLVDEAGTTVVAHELMFSAGTSKASAKKMNDSIAAALILENFFEGKQVYRVDGRQWRNSIV